MHDSCTAPLHLHESLKYHVRQDTSPDFLRDALDVWLLDRVDTIISVTRILRDSAHYSSCTNVA